MIGTKPLYVALAQPKDVRQQQLAQQNAQLEQMRNQQMAASGIPQMPGYNMPQQMYGGFQGGPGGYPQGPGGPRGGPMMGYPPQGGMMPGQRRPQYAPQGQMPGGMPGMAPYPPPPQGYPGYPQQQGRGPQGPMRGYGNGPAAPPQAMPGRPGPQGPPRGPMTQQGPNPRGPGARPPRAAEQPSAAGPTITAAALASAGPAEQKQMLGEALYPRIHESVPELAGKITGMLLEMDNSELLHLLENEDALQNKTQEAIQVLEEYSKKAEQDAGAAAPAAEASA